MRKACRTVSHPFSHLVPLIARSGAPGSEGQAAHPRSVPSFLSALRSFRPRHPVRFPRHPDRFTPASLTGPSQGAFGAGLPWAELPLGLGALQPLLPSGDVLCSETVTHKLQEVLGKLPARCNKINGSEGVLVKKKDTSNDCTVPGWKAPAGTWGGRALVWQDCCGLHGIRGQAVCVRVPGTPSFP